MGKLDLNVNNYTFEELLRILKIKEPTVENIDVTINALKTKYANDANLLNFFDEILERLMNNIGSLNDSDIVNDAHDHYDHEDPQVKDWFSNQHIQDEDEDNEVTRKQKINIFDNNHNPMKKEELNVGQSYKVPIAQGELNPKLVNITKKLTNIDSRHRKHLFTDVSYSQIANPHESLHSSSDFLIELSDPLKNVLSLKLYSINLPYTWYNIDSADGNNFFIFTPTGLSGETISIESGNYKAADIVSDLSGIGHLLSSSLNTKTGKIKLNFDTSGQITFYDITNSDFNNSFRNNNLGWKLGFRDMTYVTDASNSIVADVPLVLLTTNYLTLYIDEFNSNHLPKKLNGINIHNSKMKISRFFFNDISGSYMLNRSNFKTSTSTGVSYQQYNQGFPRQITQKQQYSINEILTNQNIDDNTRHTFKEINNVFAILPVKINGLTIGDTITDFSGGIQSNTREYFGPVDIDKLHVKLFNEMGHIINLNGGDWSFVLVTEHLYQY